MKAAEAAQEQINLMFEHEKGPRCVEKAEAIEKQMGLFDDKLMGTSAMRRLAGKMREVATSVLGKSRPDFADTFHKKLTKVQQKKESFGAQDACHFLLKHHGEL
mmetsp:Transcript_36439/g.56566  ORF Transcript_36439/g.56566 Transcript_36439/m.56566 type:complete len:104 (+) Transcript_36439:3-314(+)